MHFLRLCSQTVWRDLILIVPIKDPTIDYKEQAKLLAMSNYVLRKKIGSLKREMESLVREVRAIEEEKKEEIIKEQPVRRSYLRQEMVFDNSKKRYRRNAADIERPYKCPCLTCNKAYGYLLKLPIVQKDH